MPRHHLTQFQAGHRPHTWVPVGTYKKNKRDGFWKLKVNDTRSNSDWIEVHRLTYLDHHGPIPPGHVVVVLDGDPDNCLDPSNVAAIPRGVLMRLNLMDWGAAPDLETRLTLLALARVHEAASARAKDIGLNARDRRKLINLRRKPARQQASA